MKISLTRQPKIRKRKWNCDSRNLRHFTSTGEKLNKASNKHDLTTILQFFHGKFQDFEVALDSGVIFRAGI